MLKQIIKYFGKEDNLIIILFAVLRIFLLSIVASLILEWESGKVIIEYMIKPMNIYEILLGIGQERIKIAISLSISLFIVSLLLPYFIEPIFISLIGYLSYLRTLVKIKIGIEPSFPSFDQYKQFFMEQYDGLPLEMIQKKVSQLKRELEVVKLVLKIALFLSIFYSNWIAISVCLILFYLFTSWSNNYEYNLDITVKDIAKGNTSKSYTKGNK